jgi:hypothetical protein
MAHFNVQVPEIWYQWYRVEAACEREALELVRDGVGTPHAEGPSYCDSLDSTYLDWLIFQEIGDSVDG